jgi:hypothetical protein
MLCIPVSPINLKQIGWHAQVLLSMAGRTHKSPDQIRKLIMIVFI